MNDREHSWKIFLTGLAAGLVVALLVGATITNRFPLVRAYLQSPLDGAGQSITNMGSISVSNLTVMGGTVSGIAASVTNGDSSISTVSTSGVHYVRATNITEAKLLLSDNTTADASTSAHGLLPKVSGTSNSISLNWNGTLTWKVLTNLIRAGTSITLNDTNGIVTIAASGSSLAVNGTSASNANITNTSTMVWGITDSTNIVGYPTNLANAQVSASAAIAKSKISSSGTWTAAEIPTLQTVADGGGNTIKMKGYIVLASPFNCDGAGAIIETNNNTLAYFGQALFANAGAASTNWVEYRITVPEDIDTSIDLKVERFKFRLAGADTGAHSYVLTQAAVADSASYDSPSLSQSVTLSFAGDGSGASGDVETISNVTLTNWAANVTAGRLWVIRLARNGDSDASTVNSYSGPLVISYGLTQ